MSTDKISILLVDDSPDDIKFVMENLKDDYALQAATSGKKALEMLDNGLRPAVILMDVMMPEMDGYETCRQIKSNTETENIEVLFVSAHDSTEEKLSGYEAGGDDYIIKPVQPIELLQKIKLAINNKALREAVMADKNMAMQTAMTAMSNSGELGVVLEFLKQSFVVTDITALARLIIDAVSNYTLNSSVKLYSSLGDVTAGSKEPIPPIEDELLSRLRGEGRIMERGARLILNYGKTSLLIKNLPDDDDKKGRLRDHLAILLEGADARLTALEAVNENQSRNTFLQQIVREAEPVLGEIATQQAKYKEDNMHIMDDIMQQVEEAFLNMGLTEEQEENLLAIVKGGVDKTMDNLDSGFKVDEDLRGIINQLAQFASGDVRDDLENSITAAVNIRAAQ